MFLGEFITIYRARNKLTLQEFADKCGLSKGYIAMLEKNYNPKTKSKIIPSISTFAKVAAAMGISLDSLMAQVDENQPIILQDLADKDAALCEEIAALKDALNETLCLTDDEKHVIRRYRQLSPSRKADIKLMMDSFIAQSDASSSSSG